MNTTSQRTWSALALSALLAACSDDPSGDVRESLDGQRSRQPDASAGSSPRDDDDGPDFDPTAACTLTRTGIASEPMDLSPEAEESEIAPAPASIGADVPLTYFGPPPTTVNKNLIGPYQLLKAGTLDLEAATITLPLYQGRLEPEDGTPAIPYWYVVTDTTDHDNADALGINHSAKLDYARVGQAVRHGRYDGDGVLVTSAGRVDFAPERIVTPGVAPALFPPTTAMPGSVGDAAYSPLVEVQNAGGNIYNAPIVAFGIGAEQLEAFCTTEPDPALVHDKVRHICPSEGTVTLALTSGFSFGRPVLYLSLEASVAVAATLEGATLAPGLADVPIGHDDSLYSAVERIFVIINGPTGKANPHRQGLDSALLGEGSPLNTLGGIPTIATDYSPLWDMNLAMWSSAAVDAGYRARVFEEFQILGLAEQGHLTGPGGQPFGSVGIIVNCPIVYRFL